MSQDTFFFFITRKKNQKIYQKQFTFSKTEVSQNTDKGALDFPKCLCSLDTQVSVSTDWEIKMKNPMFLKRLLKNTFVGQRYTLKNLYLTKFSSE